MNIDIAQIDSFFAYYILQIDIWGGNTVVRPRAHVVIDSCILRSDTRRGELYSSSIIDCAGKNVFFAFIFHRDSSI